MNKIQKIKTALFFLPLLEIAGFIIVGSWIGVLATLLLVVFTTIIGFVVLRFHGFMSLMQLQRRMQAGEYPAIDMLGNSLSMFGGLLLILPGFITDIIGLLLLIPAIRVLVLRRLVATKVFTPGPSGPEKPSSTEGRTIEGEFRREKK